LCRGKDEEEGERGKKGEHGEEKMGTKE